MKNLRHKHVTATEAAPLTCVYSHVPPERHVRLHLPMGAREKWGSGYGVCELPVLLFRIYKVEMFLS